MSGSRSAARRWLVVAVLVSGLVLSACSAGEQPSEPSGRYDSPILNEDVPVVDIAKLPDIEQTRVQMLDLIERVHAEVSRLVPASEPWEWTYDESRGGCTQQGTGRKGVRLYLRKLRSRISFTDEQWALVFPVVQRLAGEAGLTSNSAMGNASGNHDVRFNSKDGRTLVFGSREASLITGSIACRRDAPLAEPTAPAAPTAQPGAAGPSRGAGS